MHKVYAFDAYGTLFDVHAAVRRHRGLIAGDCDALSELWRAKQLEYSWTRALMGAYRDFAELTEQALDFAIRRRGGVSEAARAALLSAYRTLDAFPDVVPALRALKDKGALVCVFSNGSPDMLSSAIAASGLAPVLDAAISVDAAQTFKTAPETYQLVTRRYGVAPAEVSFQSSNRWDIAGAVRFGFRSVWINRQNAPDEYQDLPPAAIVGDLGGLLSL